jgi:hypothetical protein
MGRDRYIIVKETITTPGGNAIGLEIKASGAALLLFSPADRNRIAKNAMSAGAERFKLFWLPKRFEPYARTLGYHAGKKYMAMKQRKYGHADPLTLDGKLNNLVLQSAYTVAKGKGEGVYSEIRFRRGRTNAAVVRAVLQSLAPNEVKDISKVVAKSLTIVDDAIMTQAAGSQSKHTKKLTTQARQNITASLKRKPTARSPRKG